MEETPSFRGVPIRYFRAQDGALQFCLKDVCEALGMEDYQTVAIPIKKWFGVSSLGTDWFYTKRARKFGRWLEAEFFPYVMKQSVGEC